MDQRITITSNINQQGKENKMKTVIAHATSVEVTNAAAMLIGGILLGGSIVWSMVGDKVKASIKAKLFGK